MSQSQAGVTLRFCQSFLSSSLRDLGPMNDARPSLDACCVPLVVNGCGRWVRQSQSPCRCRLLQVFTPKLFFGLVVGPSNYTRPVLLFCPLNRSHLYRPSAFTQQRLCPHLSQSTARGQFIVVVPPSRLVRFRALLQFYNLPSRFAKRIVSTVPLNWRVQEIAFLSFSEHLNA